MTTASSASATPVRTIDTGDLLLTPADAVLFSAKTIVARLVYRYQADAIMVIALHMLLVALLFMAMR